MKTTCACSWPCGSSSRRGHGEVCYSLLILLRGGFGTAATLAVWPWGIPGDAHQRGRIRLLPGASDHSQTNFLWCVYLREIVLGATSIWHLAVWKSSQPSGSAVLQQPSRLAEGPANPTCLCLINQNFANTSETFQYWQKASACEDAVPHARSMCVLWQSLLKLLWTRVPQKCQAGAGLLTRTAVGGGAQGLLPRR